MIRCAPAATTSLAEPAARRSRRADQAEQQRRQRQQREEAGLGGQPGDPVPDADRGGLLGQPPGDVADTRSSPRRPVRDRNRPARSVRSPAATLSTVGHMSAPHPTTHEVTNQAPPLVGHDVFATDAGARRGGRAGTTARRARRRAARTSAALAGSARGAALGRRGQRAPAGAAHPRPLRPPHRRGRLPPVLAPAAWSVAVGHGLTAPPGRRPTGRPRRAGPPGFVVWTPGRGRATAARSR